MTLQRTAGGRPGCALQMRCGRAAVCIGPLSTAAASPAALGHAAFSGSGLRSGGSRAGFWARGEVRGQPRREGKALHPLPWLRCPGFSPNQSLVGFSSRKRQQTAVAKTLGVRTLGGFQLNVHTLTAQVCKPDRGQKQTR